MEQRGVKAETSRQSPLAWASPWKVCLSEQLCVRGADRVYMEFATKRSALLLIRLALWPRRTFSRASLCELLWPDDDPQATRGLLRNELARLKRSLG
jgi:DNA-binding response OmpR family regulator